MKVLHINAGTETGGGKVHLISLLSQFNVDEVELLTFQKGLISEEAKNIGIKTTVLNQRNQLDISILKPLANYINLMEFDIVHTHGPRANLYIGLIRKKIKTKWIITVHSDPQLDFLNKGIKGKVFSTMNLKSIKKADSIIAVSTEIEKYLIDIGYSKDKVKVVHNGIKFPDYDNFSKPYNSNFNITHIGRFHPIKRHEYLLDSLIKSGISNYKINFIGDGELLNSIKQFVVDKSIYDKVTFHGYLKRCEIDNVLKKTDLSLLTSKSETFPLVLLESASIKIPFITTDVGDVQDLDPSGENSWIVPVDNQDLLIKSLEEAYELWSNKTLHLKGDKLHAYVSEKFTLDEMFKETYRVYSNMLR